METIWSTFFTYISVRRCKSFFRQRSESTISYTVLGKNRKIVHKRRTGLSFNYFSRNRLNFQPYYSLWKMFCEIRPGNYLLFRWKLMFLLESFFTHDTSVLRNNFKALLKFKWSKVKVLFIIFTHFWRFWKFEIFGNFENLFRYW